MSRPPYLRRFLAVAVIVLSLAADLRPDPTVEHPFATEPIAAGTVVERSMVEMRPVPIGLFDPVTLPAVAAHAIGSADPVLVSALDTSVRSVPGGWWLVPIDVVEVPPPGTEVRLVLAPDEFGGTAEVVPGMVVGSASSSDGFLVTARVAVPADRADRVAVAAMETRIAVLEVPAGG